MIRDEELKQAVDYSEGQKMAAYMVLGRGKPKDAYDIYCTIEHFPGGIRALTKEFIPHIDKELIQKMRSKLEEKFASVDHAGPADIVAFLGISDEEEIERIKQDAYQKIHYLVNKLEQ